MCSSVEKKGEIYYVVFELYTLNIPLNCTKNTLESLKKNLIKNVECFKQLMLFFNVLYTISKKNGKNSYIDILVIFRIFGIS